MKLSFNTDNFRIIFTLVTLGVGFLYTGFKARNRARSMVDTPRSVTSSAAQGQIELQGFAWPKSKPINMPFTFDCLYYTFKLQKLVTSGSGKSRRREWKTVYSRVLGDNFYIIDTRGVAEVIVADADFELDLGLTTNWSSLSSEKKKFLLDNVIDTLPSEFPPTDGFFGFFSPSYRIIENEIYVGAPVYINGYFKTLSQEFQKIQSTGLTKFTSQVFKPDGTGLKELSSLLDTDRNRRVDASESQNGYSNIAKISIRNSLSQNLVENEFQIFGQVGKTNETALVISDAHEHHAVERLKGATYVKLTLGTTMLSIGFFLATFNFNDPMKEQSAQNASRTVSSQQPAVKGTFNTLQRDTYDNERTRTMIAEMIANEHHACTKNDLPSCQRLVERNEQEHFSTENIQYYRRQVCKLSGLANCN